MFLSHFVLLLSVLHTNGKLHGNISPENIFLASGGIFRLGDYGIVPALLDSKRDSVFQPTMYSAPEVVDQRRYSISCLHLFIMGVLVFHLHLMYTR